MGFFLRAPGSGGPSFVFVLGNYGTEDSNSLIPRLARVGRLSQGISGGLEKSLSTWLLFYFEVLVKKRTSVEVNSGSFEVPEVGV